MKIGVFLTKIELRLLIETVAGRKFNARSNPALEAELGEIKKSLTDALWSEPVSTSNKRLPVGGKGILIHKGNNDENTSGN